jgi:hypothetical protein
MVTVRTTEEAPRADLSEVILLPTASEFQIDIQTDARLMNSIQPPPVRAQAKSRAVSLLLSTLLITTSLIGVASAQERPTYAPNEFGLWFDGQFGNGHAFGSTTDSRMYQVEARYGRIVYRNHLFDLHYVAEVVPLTLVGQRQANGQRVYAYGGGGSPIGAQVNFLHDRRVQPFLISSGGFLSFNRRMFDATQFNFTAQLGAGVQVFTSRHHSIDFGYKYHHISNANRGRINPGMDSHVVFVGVSFFR